VPSLADLQANVRRALTSGDVTSLASVLVGGGSPLHRLAIHRRHYQASLVTALLEKFPATVWLIGSDAVAQVAHAFVRAHPPLRPCIAEYGSAFPAFLAASHTDTMPPYVRSFAELEWAVAQASIAITEPPAAWSDVVAVGAEVLPGTALRLQPGLRFVRAKHAVDELMRIYLGGTEPDQFTLADEDAWIQVRGARGDIGLLRLDAPTFTFRAALRGGQSLGHAVEQALVRDAGFDAASALRVLIAEGLVASIGPRTRGDA
jgi:Putative DNA-binding domain